MEKFLTWTKGLFDSNYQIFEQGKIKNNLLFDTWKNEAKSVGLTQNFVFITNGLFNQTTTIYDDNQNILGTITYNSWQTKATVSLANGEQIAWSFTNGWMSNWMITNFKDKQINYNSSSTSGSIYANTDDELMLLAGIFIKEYYSRILIVFLIVIFIPIFLRVS